MRNRSVDNKIDWLNFLPVFNKSNRNRFRPSQSVYSSRVSCKNEKHHLKLRQTKLKQEQKSKLTCCCHIVLARGLFVFLLFSAFHVCWPSDESSLWTLQKLAAWQQASWSRERPADFPLRSRWETKWLLWFRRTLVLQEILCVCQRLNNCLHVFYEF